MILIRTRHALVAATTGRERRVHVIRSTPCPSLRELEGGFRDWGYKLATSKEFRDAVVTERESWIIDNADKKAGLSAADNAKMIEPGLDMMTGPQQKAIISEVRSTSALF